MKHALMLALFLSANVTLAADQGLDKLGSAIRVSNPFFVEMNIYNFTLFGNEVSFVRDAHGMKARDSLVAMPNFVVELEVMAYMATAQRMVTAFEDALAKNNAPSSTSLDAFKNMLLERDISQGNKVRINFVTTGDKRTITCVQAGYDDKTIVADKETFESLMSIWLGLPVDDYMNTLREQVISGASK